MRSVTKKMICVLAGVLALGVLLHFLYGWLPNPLTALFAPVRESLWEHVKILFWPLLLAGFVLTGRGGGAERAAWLLSALIASFAMLALAYVYHILLRGEAMAFDIGLYVAMMVAGFFLPRLLWPIADRPAWRWLVGLLACIMTALVVWFTFYPPETVLFADLSQGVRTFLTIPV